MTGGNENLRIIPSLSPRGVTDENPGPHLGTQVAQGHRAGYWDSSWDSDPGCLTSKLLHPHRLSGQYLICTRCSINFQLIVKVYMLQIGAVYCMSVIVSET